MEIELVSQIPNWEKVEEITLIGKTKEPKNSFFIGNYLIALRKQSKDEEIRNEVGSIIGLQMEFERIASIIGICIEIKDYETALGLLYPYTEDIDNIIAREEYFMMIQFYFPKDYFKPLQSATIGSYVYYEKDGKQDAKLISESGVKNNEIVRLLHNSKVGQVISTKEEVKLTIKSIISKEEARLTEIMGEIQERQDEGYRTKTLSFGGSTEDFLTALVNHFGENEEVLAIQRKELFEKYLKGEASFSNLVRSIYKDNPLDAYIDLTNKENCSFKVQPLLYYSNIRIEDSNILLDFTSLLLFYELTNSLSIKFENKFSISAYMLEILDGIILEEELTEPSVGVIKFINNQAIPISIPEDYKKNRIKLFKSIREWCNNYCEIKTTTKKLDVLRQFKEKRGEIGLFLKFHLDIMCLTGYEGLQLVSDDNHHKLAKVNLNVIPTELYLRKKYSDKYDNQILPLLVDKGYLGIYLSKENLKSQFERDIIKRRSFHKCIQSLPLNISFNPNTIPQAILFLKDIYMSDFSLMERNRIATTLLSYAFQGVKNNAETKEKIIQLVTLNFRVLVPQRDQLIKVINDLFTS